MSGPGLGGGGPVPPGTGWPGDLATAVTPVATDAAAVRSLASDAGSLAELVARESLCRACPRLVEWRERVAAVKRASSREEPYWGRPVTSWGDDRPRVLIVGLAPAAHGGNRTGRVFTGDRSGDFLFAALHRCGFAERASSVAAGDGQHLWGVRITTAVRCAPPANKPSVTERDTCAPWLTREFELARGSVRAVVCLGGFAWRAMWPVLAAAGLELPRPRPAFGHGVRVPLPASPGAGQDGTAMLMIGCYHPSQQNTFTGRVTPPMLDAVLTAAGAAAGLPERD